jgi:hypothetical protein
MILHYLLHLILYLQAMYSPRHPLLIIRVLIEDGPRLLLSLYRLHRQLPRCMRWQWPRRCYIVRTSASHTASSLHKHRRVGIRSHKSFVLINIDAIAHISTCSCSTGRRPPWALPHCSPCYKPKHVYFDDGRGGTPETLISTVGLETAFFSSLVLVGCVVPHGEYSRQRFLREQLCTAASTFRFATCQREA